MTKIMATIVVITNTDAVIINQTQFSQSAISTNLTKEGPIILEMVQKNETNNLNISENERKSGKMVQNDSKMVGNTRELSSKGALLYWNLNTQHANYADLVACY